MHKKLLVENVKESFSKLPVFWKLFPLFIIYMIISLVLGHREPVGDENRYLLFANNLLNGFYSPPPPEISLWNGPGYPLVVAGALYLGANKVMLSVLNAFLLFGSLLFIQKSVCLIATQKKSFIYTVIAGLYLPIWFYIPLVLTEILTWFLISLISFLFLKTGEEKRVFSLITLLLAVSIALLILTKVIFAYAVVVLLCLSLFFLLNQRLHKTAKKIAFASVMSLVFCLPYLYYTHSLTGNFFYWSNSGSMSLYTMSSPDISDFGDWKGQRVLKEKPYHKEFIDSVLVLTPLERDEAYMEKAIQNIREHPGKYVLNWVANVNRLLFSFPLEDQSRIRTYYSIFKLLPQAVLVSLILLTLGAGFMKWREIPSELLLLLLFTLIYLGGTSLLSAIDRMFYVTMPVWAVYMACIFEKVLDVSITFRR